MHTIGVVVVTEPNNAKAFVSVVVLIETELLFPGVADVITKTLPPTHDAPVKPLSIAVAAEPIAVKSVFKVSVCGDPPLTTTIKSSAFTVPASLYQVSVPNNAKAFVSVVVLIETELLVPVVAEVITKTLPTTAHDPSDPSPVLMALAASVSTDKSVLKVIVFVIEVSRTTIKFSDPLVSKSYPVKVPPVNIPAVGEKLYPVKLPPVNVPLLYTSPKNAVSP